MKTSILILLMLTLVSLNLISAANETWPIRIYEIPVKFISNGSNSSNNMSNISIINDTTNSTKSYLQIIKDNPRAKWFVIGLIVVILAVIIYMIYSSEGGKDVITFDKEFG